NCAVLTGLLPPAGLVEEFGTGAWLPGIALAIRRPDLHIDLVESLRRRAEFLSEAVETLGLGDEVRVVRGRAEAPDVIAAVGDADRVYARAGVYSDSIEKVRVP